MQGLHELVSNNLDIWLDARQESSSSGRGRKSKSNLYGVQKLRELILELAIRGKLVPQSNTDEPSSVVIEDIKKIKAKLVKGKVVKNKKMVDISEADVTHEIPRTWSFERLGNIGNIFNGNSVNARIKNEKYSGLSEGLPFIATKDVGYGFQALDYSNGVLIPVNEPKFKVAKKGAVLICSEGGSAGKKCGITSQDICFGNKLFANELFGNIVPEYILAYYLSPSFYNQFQNYMTGIIGGISSAKFSELIVAIPPIDEQKRIVKKLNQLMAFCDELERKTEANKSTLDNLADALLHSLENCESSVEAKFNWQGILDNFDLIFTSAKSIQKLKLTILQLAVSGKLVSSEEPDEEASKLLEKINTFINEKYESGLLKKRKVQIKEISSVLPIAPNSKWSVCKVHEISELVTDGTHKTPIYQDNGVRFVSAKDISTEELVFSDCKYISEEEHAELTKRCKPEYGDILISKSGSIGTVVVVEDKGEFSLFESLALIKYPQHLINKYVLINKSSQFQMLLADETVLQVN